MRRPTLRSGARRPRRDTENVCSLHFGTAVRFRERSASGHFSELARTDLPDGQVSSACHRRQAKKLSSNEPARENQFIEPFQQIYPTGKSPKSPSSPLGKNILIFRSRKPVYIPPVSPDERGGSRSSRTRGGMRWTRKLRLTSATRADGEIVWA